MCGMPATHSAVQRGTSATVHLRVDVFDDRCAALGLTSEGARAAYLGSDRSTLYRLRRGLNSPTGEVITRWARRLGVSVEELWEARCVNET